MGNKYEEFAACIVLYNPDWKHLISAISELLKLGIPTFIFDNTEDADQRKEIKAALQNSFKQNIHLFSSPEGNIGLAAAYNFVAKKVVQTGIYQGLFLFDQDSIINKNAIESIVKSYSELLASNAPIGTISGYPIRKNGVPYRIRHLSGKNIRNNQDSLLQVKSVPSSYSLIPTLTFKQIGYFEEDFFIDCIDGNYSLRCRKEGLPVYIDKNGKFTHDVGIGDVIIFGKHLFPIANDYRYYYQIRNIILSKKRNDEKYLKDILLRFVIVLITAIYTIKPFPKIKYFIKGVLHGIANKSGSLNQLR
nr:hypothetical protein [uncultured Draconibacterium sp.]